MSAKKNLLVIVVAAFVFNIAILMPNKVTASDGISNIILIGLNAYKEKGPEAAIKTWLTGSALENSPEAQSQSSIFRQVETLYGKYLGYGIIMVKNISASSDMVFLTINYEKGPVFASFLVYKNQKKEIIAQLNFHTKPDAVLPAGYWIK